jgi:hypothetical protein
VQGRLEHLPNDSAISTPYWEDQKDIPNMYNPELAMTKGIWGFLSKKPQGAVV